MRSEVNDSNYKCAEDFRVLSHQILIYANRNIPKIDFLREILTMIINFSKCDVAELWLNESDKYIHCEITQPIKYIFQYEVKQLVNNGDGAPVPFLLKNSILDLLRLNIIKQKYDSTLPVFTSGGSFWIGDTGISLSYILDPEEKKHYNNYNINGQYKSIALIPLVVGDDSIGLLQLMSDRKDFFTENDIELYEDIARIIGIAVVNQRAQAALRERIKELICLYNIAQIIEKQELSLSEILQGIVEFLPPAWQYPGITTGRIIFDGHTFTTSGFLLDRQKQTSDIFVKGERRGVIEVAYMKKKPDLDEGPFLKEERKLINAIARHIGLLIERKEAEEKSSQLQEQLRHADRLATIGQLGAGVAHELNEPLGNILGFAQLAMKCPELPNQANRDIEKIVEASLHAREVIKKLMIFARQMPSKATLIDLNKAAKEGLYFFEARCARAGIELVRSLIPDIPEITGDPSQLNQVLVNLVVNSIQAMPKGGKLTIQTYADDKNVFLVVEDTGIGMSEDTIKKIFIPFFTTKDVDEGTGLGLAVVHEIVKSHKGSIAVESAIDQGTSFKIQLPITGA
ncbi:MAG: GAF domain-containing protein [candidate division Zixibacteria bacterium]|nr:GAF domain-containing protein [candidate division Zixibacteria bacterium]